MIGKLTKEENCLFRNTQWLVKSTGKNELRDFLGGPVVKTLPSNAGGESSIPGCEAKIPHAHRAKKKKKGKKKTQNLKQKQCCKKFNKDFKNGPHLKKKKNLKKNK